MAIQNRSNFIIDETAIEEWRKYMGNRTMNEAFIDVKNYHSQHIAATLNLAAVADGGLFLTDIPNTDLTVLEVRLADKGSIGLYSRAEASSLAGLILDILGAQAATHH